MSHTPGSFIYRLLDTVGDGTGTKNANVNGSVTPVTFKLITEEGPHRNELYRMVVHIVDAGPLNADDYGGIAGGLVNGLDIGIYNADDSLLLDLLDGLPVKTNSDWGRLCYDVKTLDFGTGTDDAVAVRWTFSKDMGGPIILEEGQYIGVTVNDNLTGLIEHYFTLRGNIRHL
jgi:hypothetical protein